MDKTIVLTGASGVLCAEFARALSREGYRLALIARHKEALQTLCEEIRRAGGTAFSYPADVTDEKALNTVHEKILHDLGPCDILINGAGGNHPSGTTSDEFYRPGSQAPRTFFNLDKEGFSYVFDLNMWGTVLPCQIFGADMPGRKDCCILNISSMAAFSPLTKTPAYSASKAGISNFTQWLAVHMAPAGIRVNAIAPGFFLTAQNHALLMNEDGTPTPRAGKIISQTPMGRFGQAEELTGALLFLIDSARSGFITGCVLPIDGGFSAYSGV